MPKLSQNSPLGVKTGIGMDINGNLALSDCSLWEKPAANDEVASECVYYHNDHLGTPKKLTDQNQQVVWSATHDPFGKADITTEEVTNNLRFPGQVFDEETGLHYNWWRYYSPLEGRYVTSDPVGLVGGLNTFLYADANALINVDPDGLLSKNKSDPDGNKPWKGTRFPAIDSDADKALRCMEKCMGVFNIMISGGAECTTDGRHQPGSTPGSKHCKSQAFDIPRYWHSAVDQKSLLCCARDCGIQYVQNEGTHYHFQTTPGRNGGSGILPSKDECDGECRKDE